MDTFADDNRLRPPPLACTHIKVFFITLIELQGLKRMLTARNKSEVGIVKVLTTNTIYIFFNQRKTEFWPALAV